ncbi:hypothetical protein IPH92_02560 [Candidatus Kaiserbacteria bacterium]|nr:MAG: hypothetical protein IPH92_02560 [Candidatus Kaiserbacteria bacterium]
MISTLTFTKRLVSFVLALIFISTQLAFAQVDPTTLTEAEFKALSEEEQQKILSEIRIMTPVSTSPAAPSNTVNCFDYYSFGSVQVHLSPTLEQTIPGMPLTFTGTLKNANAYPVVGGQVYAKIFKVDDGDTPLTHQNGHPLVSFFLVQDNVVIPANGEIPATFTYQVPKNMAGGAYTIAYFFTTENRYNLLGLSFTDDVTGNKANFSITDDTNTPVTFNKNTVMLNKTPFSFAAFPPHFTKDEAVTAHVEAVNPANTERVVEVTWIISQWDGILAKHEVKRETQGVLLKPKEKKTLSYTLPKLDTSVTFIQAILKDQDAESILHIRYVRDGNEELRINYPSITEYPLTAGKETTVFSCLHSTNLPIVSDNLLTLTLKDENNDVIHTYTYEGDVTGAMMGVKDTFTPPRDLTTFSLTAALTHKGALVDEVTIHYDCNALGAPCPEPRNNIIPNMVSDSVSPSTYIMLIAALMLSLMGAVLLYTKRRGVPANQNTI